jgi:transmembrane sensor
MADEASFSGTPSPSSSSDDPPFDWDVLARYSAGECSAEEKRAVDAWLVHHPHDAVMFAALNDAIARQEGLPAAASEPALTVDVEGALRRVKSMSVERPAGEAKVLPMRRIDRETAVRSVWPRVIGLAAAAGLVALAIEFRGPVGTPRPLAARSYTTPVGTRDSVQLADGSRVVLAPGSRLETGAGFGKGSRDVTLDGAAYFDVRHDASAPFTVHAGGAIVRDVGTSFSVRADAAADSGSSSSRGRVVVAVTSGIVTLRSSTAPSDTGVRLVASDRAVVQPDGRVDVQKGGAMEGDTAWRQGRLVYRGAPLDEVRVDLRRWYGLELRVADSTIAQRRLTATFDGDSPARVLEVIGLALGAVVERSGDTVVLRRAAVAPR